MKRPCHLMATFAKAKWHRRNGATPFINSANALATRPGTAVEDIDSEELMKNKRNIVQSRK